MPRFLLIGLDGAEPSLIGPWMAEGRLPHLARLAERGTFLRASSTVPCATFPAWATCVTGVGPGRHGLIDFTEMIRGQYAIRFKNGTFRQAPALWNVLSDAGKRVGVLGVPGTYPPEPVNGFIVSGFDSPVATRIDASFVHPPALYPEVRQWRFADFQESDIGPGWHDRAIPLLLRAVDEKSAIAVRLLAREPWDFFMVVFGESDTVAHHFWMFHDPRSPRYRRGREHAIREVYERLDDAVGALVRAAGEDVVVGVVSDHGFGGAGTGVVHLNNWLAERGYLRFCPTNGGLIKRAAMACVPEHWRGGLFRRFRGVAARAESGSRFGGIDWSATAAWSEELNYFPSVRVNLEGREPKGQVRARDYDAFVRDLCHELEDWGPVARAWPRAELYDGPHVDRAPDIILELALENGYAHSCLRARGGPGFRRLRDEEYFGAKERGMNGTHRPTGMLILSEPCAATEARLEDVAPTVLATLGVPAPPMEGQALLHPHIEVLPRGEGTRVAREVCPYSEDEARTVEKRLRALGYYE